MTSTTTREQAIEVLQLLTAEHGQEPYFEKADVVYNDGFFCVDLWVDAEKWKTRERREQVPPRINQVPICVVMNG